MAFCRDAVCWLWMASVIGGCATRSPQACARLPDGKARALLAAPQRHNIRLDGDLRDWDGVPFTTVTPASGVWDAQTLRIESPADLSFRFAVCHDEEALYVAIEVRDDHIVADSCEAGAVSCPAWDDDAVEVFLDGNHNHAADARVKDGSELRFGGEFALVVNGAANSDYSGYPKSFGRLWQGAINWRMIQNGGKTACYELRLPWAVMGGAVKPGDTIGFNVSVQDDDDGARRDHALYYQGSATRPFVDERYFADVYLVP